MTQTLFWKITQDPSAASNSKIQLSLMRLSRFLSLSVAISRNQARFFIGKGRVCVDARVITDPNFEVSGISQVIFDGNRVAIVPHRYIILNKPASYICEAKNPGSNSVLDLLKHRFEAQYYHFANVLGPQLTGLVLLSDDARWTNRMKLKMLKKVRVYKIRLKNIVADSQLERIRKALSADPQNKLSSVIYINKQTEKTISLKTDNARVTEILNLFDSEDLRVELFHLEQIGRLSLGNLKAGDYLELIEGEIKV